MGNEQSRKPIYKPPLRENLSNKGLTLENAKNDYNIRFDPSDQNYQGNVFNVTNWQTCSGDEDSNCDTAIRNDDLNGNKSNNEPNSNKIYCKNTGYLYRVQKQRVSCNCKVGICQHCDSWHPRCAPNTNYYKEKKDSNIVDCCLGNDTIKNNGKIDIQKCSFITEENKEYATKRGCGKGKTGADCNPPTTAETWAPWSKTCALETETIKDYCSNLIVVQGDTKNPEYKTIYMLVPLTEDNNSNCKHWKEYKGESNKVGNKIRDDYDDIIKNFCKITGSIDNDDNNLNGFSFPCSCYNYQENPVYKALLTATETYCEKFTDPKCTQALASPQCWLQDCRDPVKYILKSSDAAFEGNCPQTQCSVFLNIADNEIGGNLTVGDVTVNACSPPLPPLSNEQIVIVASTVGVLVFLTLILFIFKFLRKK